MFAHSRDPHPAIKLWWQVPFTKSKTFFKNWNALYAVLFEKQMYNSGNFNGKNRWIIKKVTVLKKLLPHLATRGTYSPGDWRCDEAWREQTLVYPPVMCQQRLIYCTWELNVMWVDISPMIGERFIWNSTAAKVWRTKERTDTAICMASPAPTTQDRNYGYEMIYMINIRLITLKLENFLTNTN